MTAPSPDQLEVALSVADKLVAAIRPEQWAAPTPCTTWDVRALVGHLVSGNQLFADLLNGATTVEEARRAAARDVLGDDPVRAFHDAGEAVLAAFRGGGALDRPVTVPFGTVPGTVALHLRLTEVLVHGWDLARATDQEAGFDDAVIEQELQFSSTALTQLPPDRSPFAPSLDVPADAPALDRLAGLLGRDAASLT
jgi:uncharacterized protein (TIGR03086 family)